MKIIIFGATGMVGQGVLRECLVDAGVARVTSTEQMGRAMVHVARGGYPGKVLEMKDINSL
jgi:hypothetical protein